MHLRKGVFSGIWAGNSKASHAFEFIGRLPPLLRLSLSKSWIALLPGQVSWLSGRSRISHLPTPLTRHSGGLDVPEIPARRSQWRDRGRFTQPSLSSSRLLTGITTGKKFSKSINHGNAIRETDNCQDGIADRLYVSCVSERFFAWVKYAPDQRCRWFGVHR